MDAYDLQGKSSQMNANYQIHYQSKPMMIYYFLDPLSKDSWITETHLKKMTIEYGAYFNVRPIINHAFDRSLGDMKYISTHCKLSTWDQYYLSISMKAATLQGNRAGRDFLRHIQQSIFLHQEHLQHANNTMIRKLIAQAARKSNLDLKEFYDDLFSDSVKKVYQSDIQLKQEMDVKEYPTFVFFSEHVDDHGVKVSGVQNYETYTYILKDMLQIDLPTQSKPSLKETLAYFKMLQTEDIAFIYDCSHKEAERELKQLQLMRIVRRIEVNGFHLWEYCG